MHVTVFGGTQTKPGEPAYSQAVELGKLLAGRGFTVINGGYIGTMEAVSRGAAEAGGYVIGITCDEIEAFRPGKANQWISEEVRYQKLRDRLFALIDRCDAAIALPGGVGTMTEVMAMWNNLLVKAITPRPLILVGADWFALINQFYQALGRFVPLREREWIAFAKDVHEAVDLLRK